MDEEHGGEDGLLFEAKNENGKLTKDSVKDRLTEIKDDEDAGDERQMLEACAALIDQLADAKKKVRERQRALDAAVAARYKTLSEDEVKTLVVDDKWLAAIATAV